MYPGWSVGIGVGPAAVGEGSGEPVASPAGVIGRGNPVGRTSKIGELFGVALGVGVGIGGGPTGLPVGRGLA